jgi:hypothetical protein
MGLTGSFEFARLLCGGVRGDKDGGGLKVFLSGDSDRRQVRF